MLEQLAQLVLPKEILERFLIVKIDTDEADIDAMSMTIHLDEHINRNYANQILLAAIYGKILMSSFH